MSKHEPPASSGAGTPFTAEQMLEMATKIGPHYQSSYARDYAQLGFDDRDTIASMLRFAADQLKATCQKRLSAPSEGAGSREKADDWICERHPWLPMGHEGCGGAGCPPDAAIPLLRNEIRLLRQELRERDSLHGLTAMALLEASREGSGETHKPGCDSQRTGNELWAAEYPRVCDCGAVAPSLRDIVRALGALTGEQP